MDAQPHPAVVQPAQRQGVVDFGGCRIVDAERGCGGQRQLFSGLRYGQRGKSGALGKAIEQEPLHVKRPGRGDGTSVAQQRKRAAPGLFHRQRHGLVLRAILVGLEQHAVELVGDWPRAAARGEFGCIGLDLPLQLFLTRNRGESGLHLLRRRLAEQAAAAAALKVVRCAEQPQQNGGAVRGVGLAAVIVGGDLVEMEFVLRGEFPQQVEFDAVLLRLRPGEQIVRRGFVESHQRLRSLDLLPLARIEFDLQAGIGLAQHPRGMELAAVLEKNRTHKDIPPWTSITAPLM
ncbi:hypothetical protein GALL_469640 [mine drainage metagenome]|uniref:Uncharacterized protein n=1 Tax=mine drainage metagenome TaxID=410659 RepID=A0A1J5PUZ6_9ZZZZ